MTTPTYYLVEKCGDERSVWGPYQSAATAKKAAGVRHHVVSGTSRRLVNGQSIKRADLMVAVQTGSIRVEGGIDATIV